MPSRISSALQTEINAQQSGEVLVYLLRLQYTSLAAPISVCNDNLALTSRGVEYIAFPFEVDVGSDSDDAPPQPTLRIGNVDRQIVQAILNAVEPITVTIELVMRSEPDQVEVGPYTFVLRDVSFDQDVVEGTLRQDGMLNEPFPGDQITPSLFPGAFSPQG